MSNTINEDGSPVLIETLVYRYGTPGIDEHGTVEDAQRFIDSGEDWGECSSIGAYVDGEPHSVGPWDWHPPGAERVERMREEYAQAKAEATQRRRSVAPAPPVPLDGPFMRGVGPRPKEKR